MTCNSASATPIGPTAHNGSYKPAWPGTAVHTPAAPTSRRHVRQTCPIKGGDDPSIWARSSIAALISAARSLPATARLPGRFRVAALTVPTLLRNRPYRFAIAPADQVRFPGNEHAGA
ncbi:hypothetical protein [Spirillospora sp. NPDC048824]|uniref:hypothetical protein n=1 Tax=unclassified Spirillospora TaxID=2642701 RepID=UPI00371161F1